jgi:predicted dehydrogenase
MKHLIEHDAASGELAGARRPRIGFAGVGWIGRHRMEAIGSSGLAAVAAIAEPSEELRELAGRSAPGAKLGSSLEELFELDLDGVVIATPSALHAEQSVAALQRGLAVFCQKPLGRTEHETRRVIEAARCADRLLGVDLSYRHTRAIESVRAVIASGELGQIYAVDLVFHNAYGPDKPWFYDYQLSGGGCVIDLGIHLVDLALWLLDFPEVREVKSHLFAGGSPLQLPPSTVEDFAAATITLKSGAVLRLGCSWRLPAGREAAIEASFYGTEGGVSFRNVNGSFYDFTAERFRGTGSETLVTPPDDWGGRAAVAWAAQLGHSRKFHDEVERLTLTAAVLDAIYGR